jgi:hypothetical protein
VSSQDSLPARYTGGRASPPSGSSRGLSSGFRELLIIGGVAVVAVLGFVLYKVIQWWEAPSEPPVSSATTGLPEDWHIWAHEPNPSEGSRCGFVWPTLINTEAPALNDLKLDLKSFEGLDRARVDEPFIVYAKIRAHLEKHEWALLMTDASGHKVAARLNIVNRIAATLVPSSSFDVLPAGPQEQEISDNELTWTWQVIPKTVTANKDDEVLTLNFDAMITINDIEARHPKHQFTKRVSVGPKRPDTFGEWLEKAFSELSDLIRKSLHL